MFNLRSVVYFSTIFAVVTSSYLSDEVKNFQFTTIDGIKNELNFEYKSDDGQIFRGKSYAVSSDDHYSTKYIMMGANNTFYWADFTNDELENKKPFSKDVRLVEVKSEEGKLAHFRDEKIDYTVDERGLVSAYFYDIRWDTMNVCFKRTNSKENTFQYTIMSEDKSKKQVGTFTIENDRNYTLITVYMTGLYRAEFIKEELGSLHFCKSINIEKYPITPYLTPVLETQIDTVLLKLLVG